MHNHYKDILSLSASPPVWFDEHAVPRFCPFSPRVCANIYADECVLMRIRCQACGHKFLVCMSSSREERLVHEALYKRGVASTLAECVRKKAIQYGDPPNIECCPAGPTMGSDAERVIEFWSRQGVSDWFRNRDLEIDVDEANDDSAVAADVD